MAGVARKSRTKNKMSDPPVRGGQSYVKKGKSKVRVSDKSVSDAKKGQGAFKKATPYKGRVIKNKAGRTTGTVSNDGTYTRTTNPVDARRAEKKLAYDKKLHNKKSATRTSRNTRFKNAKKVGG